LLCILEFSIFNKWSNKKKETYLWDGNLVVLMTVVKK
jgi:hypothetical protein